MRIEKDSMGELPIPAEALYGASTQRAVVNFPISTLRFSPGFISALGAIKLAAAMANQELGLLSPEKAAAIVQAGREVMEGRWMDQFVVDVFQTGSGTSTNMNVNEVIANRAAELLGGKRGQKNLIHPNDDVNLCQSSNDVFPTALHLALSQTVLKQLKPAAALLEQVLLRKSDEFGAVLKAGRTHLQDATPITLGQELGGYAAQIRRCLERLDRSLVSLAEVPLGGTAVGTGINAHPEFAARALRVIKELTGVELREAENHFEAQGARDAVVEMSGQLKTLAGALMKIANDVRWLAAGPRCNLAELRLPEVQPGSSIMPGKVNPVICESVMMAAVQVMGNDLCVAAAAGHGNFELNCMMPVMAYNVLQSAELLAAVCRNFADKCISGIQADEERCRRYAEASLANCTPLARVIGYDAAAKVARHALAANKSVKAAALELGVLDEKRLDEILNLAHMTKPGGW
jgi:fumarate hydratase, class II